MKKQLLGGPWAVGPVPPNRSLLNAEAGFSIPVLVVGPSPRSDSDAVGDRVSERPLKFVAMTEISFTEPQGWVF